MSGRTHDLWGNGLRGRRGIGRILAAAAVALAALGVAPPPVAHAHDDIESSIPADRSVIDEPISTASVDFGEVIGDGVELFLTYDPGDGSTVDVGGETVKTGDTTARVDFPELTVEGTYFLRYLAPVPSDGHVLIGAISFSWGTVTVIDEGNPDIRTSSPSSRERIDDPISSAEIQFDIEIDDDPKLTLIFDRGDGENFDELGGVTTKTGPQTAQLDFDLLTEQGTYIIRYDAIATANGDEVVGATSFTYGTPSSGGSGFPIVLFVAIAVPILLIGAWLTLRRANHLADDENEVDGDDAGDEDPSELSPA